MAMIMMTTMSSISVKPCSSSFDRRSQNVMGVDRHATRRP
jgi:hypothetical protein